MTIDNLEAIVSPSSEDLLLIRHGGKEWKYPLSTLASNLVNDPTISAATLGSASHPFETANITTLNVGGSGTVNGNLTVQATTDTTTAALLKVEKTLTVKGDATVSGNFKTGTLSVTNDLNVDTLTGPYHGDGTYGNIKRVIVSETLDVNALSASDSTLTVTGSGNIETSSITASALSSLTVADSITAKALSMAGGTLTVGSSGAVTVGITEGSSDTSETDPLATAITISSGMISTRCGYSCYGKYEAGSKDSDGNTVEVGSSGFLTGDGKVISEKSQSDENTFFEKLGGAIKTVGSIVSKSPILGSQVFNAVWNDLADCIPVNKEAIIEPGYCYCFDGEKYYKSTKYLEKGIIGIESDTYGMHMGSKPGVKQMDVAVSGFALAYVDKEYESGTPLTCTENGYLTEIAKQDKIEYPERIVGTYWKPEPNEEWGSSDRKVKVNGRHWIKIR